MVPASGYSSFFPTTPVHPSVHREPERLSSLVLFPLLTTALYYCLPWHLQTTTFFQFLPQVAGYLAFAAWAGLNPGLVDRLGLGKIRFWQGLAWGTGVGLGLGVVNVWVILHLIPSLGADIAFLKETPHARLPVALMVPWTIIVIAVFVELNFRGFQLGRILALCQKREVPRLAKAGPFLAAGVSSLAFCFDPFLVATFHHLHWVAMWDGLIWAIIWLRLRNLYATITAHAVEVIVMYSILRASLS